MTEYQQPFWKPRPTLTRQSATQQTEPHARVQRHDDPPHPPMVEDAIAAEEDRMMALRFRLYKAESFINFMFGWLTWMLGLRMILEFLNADAAKLFVKLTYALTTPFMLPFVGITPGFPFGPFLIDVSGFIAIFFYAMFTWLVTKAMWLILYNPGNAPAPLPARPKRAKTSEFRIR